MESKYIHVANTILHHADTTTKTNGNRRFLVAIAGIPGSGKTTTAKAVAQYLNNNSNTSRKTVILSMDGFHLPRATLDELPNREEAYIRRGAPWTFDVDGFLGFMKRLRTWANITEIPTSSTTAEASSTVSSTTSTDGMNRSTPTTSTTSPPSSLETKGKEDQQANVIYAPTFDHSTKDPIENGLKITPDVSIIIIEGNYLLLDEPGWRDIAKLVDYKIFVDTDLDEARERVARRHVQAGIEKTLDDGFRRVDGNDFLNGILVKERLIPADLVIQSHGTGR